MVKFGVQLVLWKNGEKRAVKVSYIYIYIYIGVQKGFIERITGKKVLGFCNSYIRELLS